MARTRPTNRGYSTDVAIIDEVPNADVIYDSLNDRFIYAGDLIDTPVFDELSALHPDLDTEYKPTPEQLAREIVDSKLAREAEAASEGLTYTAYTRGMAEQLQALLDAQAYLAAHPVVLVDDGETEPDWVDDETMTLEQVEETILELPAAIVVEDDTDRAQKLFEHVLDIEGVYTVEEDDFGVFAVKATGEEDIE